jgi:HSP20 family molecular chaperone IbpA
MSETTRAERDELLLGKQAEHEPQRVPVNMFETAEAVVLVAPMPGVSPEDVEIVVEPDRVRLHAGLRSPAPKEYLLHEWDYGSFDRAVDLPSIYRGPITATLGKGQLAVSIGRDGERSTGTRVVIHPTPA